MKNKLAALIEVRKIMSFVILIVFTFLSLTGTLSVDFIEYIILTVITFYFAKSNGKEGADK